MRALSACAIVLLAAFASPNARAESDDRAPETPPPTDASVQVLESMLTYFRAESSRARSWSAGLKLAVGGVSIPAGALVLSRSLGVPGFVLVGNGTLAITSGILDLVVFREPFEELHQHFEARLAAGRTADEITRETETEWEEKARAVGRARTRSGILSSGIGVVLVSVGAAVAFGDLDFPTKESGVNERSTFASMLFGFGALHLSTGAHALLVEDPIEAGWEGYRRMRSIARPPEPAIKAQLQVAPIRGGGFAGVVLSF